MSANDNDAFNVRLTDIGVVGVGEVVGVGGVVVAVLSTFYILIVHCTVNMLLILGTHPNIVYNKTTHYGAMRQEKLMLYNKNRFKKLMQSF